MTQVSVSQPGKSGVQFGIVLWVDVLCLDGRSYQYKVQEPAELVFSHGKLQKSWDVAVASSANQRVEKGFSGLVQSAFQVSL